jgi:hypothetical protein
MVTNYGILPAAEQVESAKKWIGDNLRVNNDTTDSDWDKYQMKARVLEILATAPTDPSDGIGRCFMTPYQIAIAFARRFQADFRRMGRPVGGAGAGDKTLTQYIANQLSRRIKARKIKDIEMQFLYSRDLKSLIYKHGDAEVVATPNQAGFLTSLFRLR